MRILGFDPGYGRLGFGVIDVARGKASAVAFGVITTKAGEKHQERLLEIHNDAESLVKAHKPDLIAIEELFFAKNVTTGLKVAEVRGILLMLAAKYKVGVREIKPVEVKMALTGYGKADKRQMQDMVKAVFGLSKIPRPDDAADALAIAWAAQNHKL
ncbi:MAG: crossover junction endodeoxyribonuclease RuvC [Patescibacteria group bacterium]|jgi:crossover junction endodeoxyribonuclease RuvC